MEVAIAIFVVAAIAARILGIEDRSGALDDQRRDLYGDGLGGG